MATQAGKKAEVRHTEVLGFIDHGEIKWRVFTVGDGVCECCEQTGARDERLRHQTGSHVLDYGPEYSSLWFEQSRLAS